MNNIQALIEAGQKAEWSLPIGWTLSLVEQESGAGWSEWEVWANPPPGEEEDYSETQICACAEKEDAESIIASFNAIPEIIEQDRKYRELAKLLHYELRRGWVLPQTKEWDRIRELVGEDK